MSTPERALVVSDAELACMSDSICACPPCNKPTNYRCTWFCSRECLQQVCEHMPRRECACKHCEERAVNGTDYCDDCCGLGMCNHDWPDVEIKLLPGYY